MRYTRRARSVQFTRDVLNANYYWTERSKTLTDDARSNKLSHILWDFASFESLRAEQFYGIAQRLIERSSAARAA